MTFQIALVLSILGIAVLFLVTEWMPMEVAALLVLGSLALTGLVSPTDALSGFSNPAVITVWAVFILSETGFRNRFDAMVLAIRRNGTVRRANLQDEVLQAVDRLLLQGGGVLMYAAQPTPRIDAEIAKKGHFWMETRLRG